MDVDIHSVKVTLHIAGVDAFRELLDMSLVDGLSLILFWCDSQDTGSLGFPVA